MLDTLNQKRYDYGGFENNRRSNALLRLDVDYYGYDYST